MKISLNTVSVALGIVCLSVLAGCGGGGTSLGSSAPLPPNGVSLLGSKDSIFVSRSPGVLTVVNGPNSPEPFRNTKIGTFTRAFATELAQSPKVEYLTFKGVNESYGPITSSNTLPSSANSYTFSLLGTPSNIRVRTDGIFYLNGGNIYEYDFTLQQNSLVKNSGGDCDAFDVDSEPGTTSQYISEIVNSGLGLVTFEVQKYTLAGSTFTSTSPIALDGPYSLSGFPNESCVISQDGSQAALYFQSLG